MAIHNVTEPYRLIQLAGDTYIGDESDQIYSLNPTFIGSGDTIFITDDGGNNSIELVGGLVIQSSTVINHPLVGQQLVLSLSNGAVVTIVGSDTFTYNVGGNVAGGIDPTVTDYNGFVEDYLGTTVPAEGEDPSEGGQVDIEDGGVPGPVPVYTVVADQDEVAADGVAFYTVTGGENVEAGDTVGYDLSGVTAEDLVDGEAAMTGSVTLDADLEAVIEIALLDNNVDDGEKELTVTVDGGASDSTTVEEGEFPLGFDLTSDVPDVGVQEGEAATFTITANKAVTEDTVVTFTVVPDDTTASDQGTNSTNLNDFSAGSFNPQAATILAGETTATFSISGFVDGITELPEAYSVTAEIDGFDALSATVDMIDGAGIFTLTTAQDTVLGTTDDDVVTGIFDVGNTTVTLGDSVSGGDGDDTLRLFNSDNNVSLGIISLSSVENVDFYNTDANFNSFDMVNSAVDSLTIDMAGMGDNDNDANIDGVNADTAVTVQGYSGDSDHNMNIDFTASSVTAASTSVTFQDSDVNELDSIIDAEFSAAESYAFNLNVSNIDSNDNFNINANIDLDAPDIDLDININIDDVIGEDINFYLDFNTNGISQATALVNITDSNVNDMEIDIDNNGNGTGDTDSIIFNLDGLNNEVSDENVDLDLNANYFELVAFNVSKDAVFDDIDMNDTEGNDIDITIDIDANATMTIEGDYNLNGNVGNQAITITGAGNIDLGDLDFNRNANTTATLDATGLTGDLTVFDSNGNGNTAGIDTLTSGSGDDSIKLGGYTTVVDTGAGDDFVDLNGIDYGNANANTIDGGADTDTIGINDAALLDAATAANISNFEVLDVSGAAGGDIYDMSIESSLMAVTATGPLAANVTITEAEAGTTVGLTATASVNSVVADFVYELADDTGLTDSLDVSLNASDTDTNDNDNDGQLTVTSLTAAGIETLNLTSTATTTDVDGRGNAMGADAYTNTLTLFSSAAVKTVNLDGDAIIDFSLGDAGQAITFIDASSSTGGVVVDMSFAGGNTTSATFNGSDAADDYSTTAHGDTAQGNGGADNITLGADDDAVRYAATDDSMLTLRDNDDDGDADAMSGFDVITGFGAAGTDILELSSALGLATGDARADILQKGVLPAGEEIADEIEDLIGDGVDFFDTGLVDRALAFAEDSNGDGWVFIDGDSDGDFSFDTDMVIELAGVNSLAISDISFG